jgi:hypothetical protein
LLPALALAIVYLIWAPPSADLAAQTFRTDLFEAHGFEVWSNAWYGGLHLPGYSLLYPPLASLLGSRLVGALAVVAAAGLFAMLVRPRYGDRATLAIWLFGAGAATNLFTGRLTFALGVAVAMAALVALDRGRRGWAGALAALASLASPVSGLFTAFAGGVLLVRGRRGEGLALALPALAAILVIVALFPSGGVHPFLGDTFVLISAATLILALVLPPEERTLRLGALLYAAMCLAIFLVDSPVGGNATRLGALVAAPLLALGAWGRRPAWMVALALVPLLYWQWVAPVRDLADAVGEPSVEEAYYAPLLTELDRRAPATGDFRVHIPATRNRWEAVHVAERYPMARGWLRQLESDDFDLFQDGSLTAGAYRGWLDRRAVALVAISTGAKADYLAEDEIDLIHAGLPYMKEIWSNGDWELYEVDDAVPLAPVPARLSETGFELRARAPGPIPVAVRFSPYYRVVAGDACVSEEGEWTRVVAEAAGTIRVEADLSLAGVTRAISGAGEVCSG